MWCAEEDNSHYSVDNGSVPGELFICNAYSLFSYNTTYAVAYQQNRLITGGLNTVHQHS